MVRVVIDDSERGQREGGGMESVRKGKEEENRQEGKKR